MVALSRKQWTVNELNEAVRSGRLTQRQLDRAGITGVRGDPHTGKVTLEREANDIGTKSASITVPIEKTVQRTPQQKLDSLMEKVGRGLQESGIGVLSDSIIEEIRLEYKWKDGQDIPAEAIRAILAKYLHIETSKAEEKYNKTVTYSRPGYK